MTEYAMVSELASLVKENLPCKHLLLSMEDAFVNFLQDDSSSNWILELEPMNSYDRLLLHRLADIFGFSHESVGEGDSRHLVLERSPDTSIPAILVSDILCHYSDDQYLTRTNPPLRKEVYSSDLTSRSPSVEYSIEEKEATNCAVGKRTFTVRVKDMEQPVKQRPQHSPVVARRMITHALGKNSVRRTQDSVVINRKPHEAISLDPQSKHGDEDGSASASSLNSSQEAFSLDELSLNDYTKAKNDERKVGSAGAGASVSVKSRKGDNNNKDSLKIEHVGAAKRMFAHALGIQPAKDAAAINSKREATNRTSRD